MRQRSDLFPGLAAKIMERLQRSEEMNNWRSAHILADRFIERWDNYAIQLPDGRYIRKEEPLTGRHLISHLKGEMTLGMYVLNQKNRTRLTVLDADDDVQYHQLFALANEIEIPSYMESSRRGGHLWFFHEESVSGLKAKTFGEELLAEYRLEPMEVFPKQSELGKGPGSLVRLPFGIHRKSGKRYPFVNLSDGMPWEGDVHEQILKLRDPRFVPKEALDYFTSLPLNYEPRTQDSRSNGVSGNVWERIRTSVNAVDFISEYVELSPNGLGRCPFHDDSVESFSVNREENYWNCFAGCGGGSIIDFWMKYKGLEIGEAVHELKDMLEV